MAAASASADPFEEIVMAEERFHGEGYQEGYAEGSHIGAAEGRRHGSLHGARIGSEIGSYLGFALTWQCLLQKSSDEKSSKKKRALDSLIGMIQKFPYEDPTYDKLQEDLEKIRGKFKQMKINMDDEETLREQITGRVFIYSYLKQNQNSEEVAKYLKGKRKPLNLQWCFSCVM